MKMYKLNSLTTFLISVLIVALVAFLPISLIESLWNSTVGKTYPDIIISFWQALILWLMVLTILNILGIFKLEFAVETGNSLDKKTLKKKLESLQNKAERAHEKIEEKKEVEPKEKD